MQIHGAKHSRSQRVTESLRFSANVTLGREAEDSHTLEAPGAAALARALTGRILKMDLSKSRLF